MTDTSGEVHGQAFSAVDGETPRCRCGRTFPTERGFTAHLGRERGRLGAYSRNPARRMVTVWPAPTARGMEQVYGVQYADGHSAWVHESAVPAGLRRT